LISDIKPKIEETVRKYKIDGVGFVPPTVKRETQFMKELENQLNLSAKKLSIVKIKTEVAVPQKTLNKLADRVENAKATIFIDEKNVFNNILLIDDAVGSGATLNEIAAKIRNQKLCLGKIVGLTITGSLKGFDVISEV
jgi:predicted amidophosphoribosyltransferase